MDVALEFLASLSPSVREAGASGYRTVSGYQCLDASERFILVRAVTPAGELAEAKPPVTWSYPFRRASSTISVHVTFEEV